MSRSNIITIFSLLIFLILSLFLRFYGLENSPSSLGFDEAALGYNAYSILTTGKDEWGVRLPLSLRSFDDYKPALYSYLDIPFVHFLGLSQATARMPSALWGAIGALFTMIIFKQITKTKLWLSLIIGLFVTLSPWRIHFSRIALESSVAASFLTVMVWFLINRERHYIYKIGVIIFGLLAIYTYHSARVAVPFLILLFILDPLFGGFRNNIKKTIFPAILFPFIIFLLSLPIFLENGFHILTRFNQTNLFSKFYPFTPTEIIGSANPWLSITNHPLYYLAGGIFGRFIAYFSPHNLSETFYPWVVKSAMVIVDNGILGFLGTFFFVVGLIYSLKNFASERNIRLLYYWVFAGALPAAITWEWFIPFRSLNLFPALDIISGLGLLFIINKIKQIPLFLCLFGLLFVSVLFNWLNELNYSVWINNGEFQPGGFREGASLLTTLSAKYPVVYVDTPQSQSYIFFLFYGKIDPAVIQGNPRQFRQPDGFPARIFDFGKFVYKKFSWPGEKLNHNFAYYTQSEIKEEEFRDYPDTRLYKVIDPFGRWTATIITKD